MGVTGSCELTLKIAQAGIYSAKISKKIITLVTADATVALTCATGGACAVGDTGPGGGTVFYVASSRFSSIGSACGTVCKYLETAPVGWITAPTPAGQTNCIFQYPYPADPACYWLGNVAAANWLGNATGAIGSTKKRIGSGYANTSAMIAQSNIAGAAATVARAFQGGGKTDWFLPSKAELHALSKWAVDSPSADYIKQVSPPYTPNGGFVIAAYWSSSELSGSQAWRFAWVLGFGSLNKDPTQAISEFGKLGQRAWKSYPMFVRPVRAF
jgi:hypothetical protein